MINRLLLKLHAFFKITLLSLIFIYRYCSQKEIKIGNKRASFFMKAKFQKKFHVLLHGLLCITCFLMVSCSKKKELPKPMSDDFESLSGQNLPAWQFVQTKEDFKALDFYRGIYDLKKKELFHSSSLKIPKLVHLIWLGPRPFPRASIENVRTWMSKHPDWTFVFWTDRERPLPCPGMILKKVGELNLQFLKECLAKTDNYAERSDLLRCEILYAQGGIYVDHDVKCFKSFEPLNGSFDFYCGIDMPYTSSLPTCIHATNNLIGTTPGHPILHRYMQLLVEKWDHIQEEYPGADRDAMLNRVLHRTFWLFSEAIKEANNQEGRADIVFPAYFFDAPKEELAIYAQHQYAGSWHETESSFEKMVRERLMLLSKKSNRLLLSIAILAGLNLLGFVYVCYYIRRCKKDN